MLRFLILVALRICFPLRRRASRRLSFAFGRGVWRIALILEEAVALARILRSFDCIISVVG